MSLAIRGIGKVHYGTLLATLNVTRISWWYQQNLLETLREYYPKCIELSFDVLTKWISLYISSTSMILITTVTLKHLTYI